MPDQTASKPEPQPEEERHYIGVAGIGYRVSMKLTGRFGNDSWTPLPMSGQSDAPLLYRVSAAVAAEFDSPDEEDADVQ